MIYRKSYHRDFWFRIIVSLVFTLFFLFVGSNSIIAILNGLHFWPDFTASFLLIFIVTTYISLLSGYLDKYYSWIKYFPSRFTYQLVAGILLPAAFVLGYMYIYLIVLLNFKRNEVTFFYIEFPIAILFIVFWNMIYAGYYFYTEQKKVRQTLQDLNQELFTLRDAQSGLNVLPTIGEQPTEDIEHENEEVKETFHQEKIKILVAVSGNKNIPIPVQELAYIYKHDNFTVLKTFSSETYMLNHSLDELVKLLDNGLFFRANRQFIINVKACHYFTNEENGKLAVHLFPAFDDEVIISQKRTPLFREWLNK